MIDVQKLAREAGLGTVLSHNGGSERVWIEGADWHEELERFAALVLEEAAKVCDDRAMRNELATEGADDDDATSLRSAAWQMSVCAADIRALKPKVEA